ncbi:hypothetical protein A0092_26755, partial [Salmonella enterica subsp. enterica serovar Muenster]|nr:hypothetical protein [Salmonella enterica subsp. enterica serovar Muenster]
ISRVSGFFMRKTQLHPNYGGLCGGTERCAGRLTGYANPAQFTTRQLALTVVIIQPHWSYQP